MRLACHWRAQKIESQFACLRARRLFPAPTICRCCEIRNSQNKKPRIEYGALFQFVSVEKSEVIVQAKAQVARLQTIVNAGNRIGTAAEIHIKVFNLC